MSILAELAGIGPLIREVGDVAKRFIPDPDKQREFELEAERMLLANDAEKLKAARDVMVADSNSQSALARNARPILVMWSMGMITFIALAALFDAATPVVEALAAVPAGFWAIAGGGTGIWFAGRSWEKTRGAAGR